MKTVSVIYTNANEVIYNNVMKVWLENSTKRYIIHYKDNNGEEIHTFINRENVLLVAVKDPDGWKEKEPKRRRGKPDYVESDKSEDEEE